MKSKKGFTLIELLAVIVILAVIALIAMPIILNMISRAKKKAAEDAALGYIDSINYNNELASMNNDYGLTYTKYSDDTYDIDEISIQMKGKQPTSGTVTIDKGRVNGIDICIGGYTVESVDGKNVEARGKCSGASSGPKSFSTDSWNVINKAARNNNLSAYNPGDKKAITLDIDGDGTEETYHIMVVNTTACTTETSKTACGLVLQFEEVLNISDDDNKKMNLTNTNVGGWPDTKMREYLNETIYNKLKAKIGDIIVDTTVVSGHEKTATENYTTTDKLYLLSPKEVGDASTCDSATDETRQLDYYSSKTKIVKYEYGTETATIWWLRTAYSASKNWFHGIGTNGKWWPYNANEAHDVSPAFRVGK